MGLLGGGGDLDGNAESLASAASMQSSLASAGMGGGKGYGAPKGRLRSLLGGGGLSFRSQQSAAAGSWLGPLPGIGVHYGARGGGAGAGQHGALAPVGAMPSFTASEESGGNALRGANALSGASALAAGGAPGEDAAAAAALAGSAAAFAAEVGTLSKSTSLSSSLPQIGGGGGSLDAATLAAAAERTQSGASAGGSGAGLGAAAAAAAGARGNGAAPAGGWSRQSAGSGAGGAGVPPSAAGTGGSRRKFIKLLMRQGDASPDSAFYGLRVRMGVAAGRVPAGTVVARSLVYDLAKGARRGQGKEPSCACTCARCVRGSRAGTHVRARTSRAHTHARTHARTHALIRIPRAGAQSSATWPTAARC
jgi:hypothetical protein